MSEQAPAPRVVPVYMVTGGRTQPARSDMPWEAQLTVTRHGQAALPGLRREQARIIRLCQQPVSVAEVAASLQLPMGVTQVLVSDLFEEGLLDLHEPARTPDGRPDVATLRRLIAGLKADA